MVYGRANSKTIHLINEYIDLHEKQLLDLWEKAQRGETINKIKR